jgi:hypothetical protein
MALQMIEAGSDKKPAVQRLSFHAELVERESTQ